MLQPVKGLNADCMAGGSILGRDRISLPNQAGFWSSYIIAKCILRVPALVANLGDCALSLTLQLLRSVTILSEKLKLNSVV
jgi:hypothetical protein